MSKQAETVHRQTSRRRGDRLVGTSRATSTVSEQIQIAGRGRFPVWIAGPEGVDRDLVARLIHEASEWAAGELFALDASVVPRTLLGRELFGCEQGAVPALPAAHEGGLARGAGGTVLVEGVETMPKDLQQLLATTLEQGRYRRFGGSEERALECRVIAGSPCALSDATGRGLIIPELSERFRLLEVSLAPLKDRPEDIVPIAAQALADARAELSRSNGGEPPRARAFSRTALDRMTRYEWPGNERQLREQVRLALQLATGEEIQAEDLVLDWNSPENVPAFRDAKRAFEREYVVRVLRMCKGNISKAARIAKKDRKDFYDVMRRNSIVPQDYRR
jgi:two-component system response regulator GlrR